MLQTRTVEPGTLALLKRLMALPTLDPFFLVGGTALALQLGHRKSIDLDLFTPHGFESTHVLEALQPHFELDHVWDKGFFGAKGRFRVLASGFSERSRSSGS